MADFDIDTPPPRPAAQRLCGSAHQVRSRGLRYLVSDFEVLQHDVEYAILATPTGPVRDELTNINIRLMQAEEHVRALLKIIKENNL